MKRIVAYIFLFFLCSNAIAASKNSINLPITWNNYRIYRMTNQIDMILVKNINNLWDSGKQSGRCLQKNMEGVVYDYNYYFGEDLIQQAINTIKETSVVNLVYTTDKGITKIFSVKTGNITYMLETKAEGFYTVGQIAFLSCKVSY